VVFSFPKRAPAESIIRSDLSAVEALEQWLMFQEKWCEHKPSVTISIKDDEWMDVAAWCYKHFDVLSGVSFLPFDPVEYPQAPYQTISKEQYEEMVAAMPAVDWSRLSEYESNDNTIGSQEFACVGDKCEI
jgi:ribonucleoside-diphosphate reductase alpha chain